VAKQKPKRPAKPAKSTESDKSAEPAASAQPAAVETITDAAIYESNREVIEKKLAEIVSHLNGLNVLVALKIIDLLPDYYDEHGVTREDRNRKRRKAKPNKPAGGSPLNW
jgi:hypothetical protein